MSSIDNLIIGIIIGVIAYAVQNVGKGIQKYAIEGLKAGKKIKSKNSGIWIIGTILTSIYLFIQWIALLFAPINAIAPLEAVGLIVLIIFSYFILKEQISKIEIIGIILITIGIVFATSFNVNISEITSESINFITFLLLLIPIGVIEVISIVISYSIKLEGIGIILGITAGTLMALQTVSKRITAVVDVNITILFSILTLLFSLGTMLITQFAFAKSKANRVVPFFTSTSILLSILIGIISLGETINTVQIFGIILIILGVGLLTGLKKENSIIDNK